MSKRIVYLSAALLLSLGIGVGLFLSANSLENTLAAAKTSSDAALTSFLSNIALENRNSLLLGDLRSVRNKLMKLADSGVFKGYCVFKDGLCIDQSDSYESFLTAGEPAVKAIPIFYERGHIEKWGELRFVADQAWILEMQKAIQANMKVGFILLGSLGLFFVALGLGAASYFIKGLLSAIEGTLLKQLPFDSKLIGSFLPKHAQIVRDSLVRIKATIEERELFALRAEKNEIYKRIAHDIRSPASALNLAARAVTFTEAHRELITNTAHRINELANELLSESRGQGQVTDIRRSLQEVLSEKNFLAEKKITFVDQGPLPEELCSKIDPGHFKAVLANLLENAKQASPDFTEVVLSLKDQACQIQINDQGPGISEAQMKKIGREIFSSKINGNGLGVYHAVKTIRAASGNIVFNSRKENGTSVVITLPIV